MEHKKHHHKAHEHHSHEMQPKRIGEPLKKQREPGDSSKNYCSHMEWKGSKEHSSHSHRYAK